MLMRLDGKSLSVEQVNFLLDILSFRSVHDEMVAKGYRLNKLRAPRRYPADGRLTVCFAWTIREPNSRMTVRLNGTVEVDPA